MHKYKKLKVWQKAMEIVEDVYALSLLLPATVKYSFVDQIIRSSLSIPSNIAEGAGRNSPKEFKRFLDISNGSCYELDTQLILITKIFKTETSHITSKLEEIQKMTYSLIKSLNN